MKTKATYLLFVWAMLLPIHLFGQTSEVVIEDELGNVSDDFQNFFFEALKQKAIENYDRAIGWLEKAAAESPEEGVVYFEMGKNRILLKQWDRAEADLKKALQLSGEKPEIYAALYDVYHSTNNYVKAIDVVLKLIPKDPDYREDLAQLYFHTKQYELALQTLNQLDSELGNNTERNQLRQRIYALIGSTPNTLEDLENRTARNITNEQDFLNLIYLYSNEGNSEKAFETAQHLLQAHPNSKLAHLALYKFYLEKGQIEEALLSMEQVIKADSIEAEAKIKVLNDFLLYVNNHPQYESHLEEMVALFSTVENAPEVYEKIGQYYLDKEQYQKALIYYESGLQKNPRNYNLIKNTLLLQLHFQQYTEAEKLSSMSLDFYPSQPLLYLVNGVSNSQLNQLKKAKSALETGLDFLIDDPQMEYDFYLQLSEVYNKEGNTPKMQEYKTKAQKLTQ
jgi:tetratricopeptide (TPR) repeat protein